MIDRDTADLLIIASCVIGGFVLGQLANLPPMEP